jgi:membrane protein YdbS with pleckstrin-like domain
MDNEFRKPYEYEEDKRGFILLFIVMVLPIDVLQTLSFASQEVKYLGHIKMLSFIFYAMAVLFIAYLVYTVIIVYRMEKRFALAAKRYLLVRTLFSVGNYLIVFFSMLKYENLIGKAEDQYLTTVSMLFWELVIPLCYIISFSLIWYLYFTFSKKCRYDK